MPQLTTTITQHKDSKRTLYYGELDDEGDPLPAQAGATIVTMLVSKKKLPNPFPKHLKVTLEWEGD